MDWIVYILKILYHLFLTYTVYFVVKHCDRYRKPLYIRVSPNKSIRGWGNTHSIGLFAALLLGCLEGIYSVICGPQGVFLQDRWYYAFRFTNKSFNPSASLGIYYIQKFLWSMTDNPYVFFFVSGTLFALFIILAYEAIDDISPVYFVLIGASQCYLYGLYQIKQAMAFAIGGLAIILLLEQKKKISSALLIAVAMCFHETAYILIPIYILAIFSDKKWIRYLAYIGIVITTIGFRSVSGVAVKYISQYVPSLAAQMAQYMDSSGSLSVGDSRFIVIFKGIPFYFLTWFAYNKRNELKSKIDNYDIYFLISIVVSATALIAGWDIWMFRFGELLYLPLFAYAGKIWDNLENKRSKQFFMYLFVLLLAFFTYRKIIISYFNNGGIV